MCSNNKLASKEGLMAKMWVAMTTYEGVGVVDTLGPISVSQLRIMLGMSISQRRVSAKHFDAYSLLISALSLVYTCYHLHYHLCTHK